MLDVNVCFCSFRSPQFDLIRVVGIELRANNLRFDSVSLKIFCNLAKLSLPIILLFCWRANKPPLSSILPFPTLRAAVAAPEATLETWPSRPSWTDIFHFPSNVGKEGGTTLSSELLFLVSCFVLRLPKVDNATPTANRLANTIHLGNCPTQFRIPFS